ncbi:MAG: zf-HC2 domain-containing protein [Acidobacteria bacterium]|nr:zf-HC2 domain-containing protein [Acidobacteriota bacterium]
MNCADIELLICAYVDGTLDAAGRQEVERHTAACAACAGLLRDSAAAVSFMERAEEVQPPPELLTRILFDPPWVKPRARVAGGLGARLRALLQPVLQPRFAMGMAMTILSFAMMARFVAPVRQLNASDLNPTAVWTAVDNRIYRAWQRTVKFYNSLKLVYQIQSTVRDWEQQQEDEQRTNESARPDEHKLPVSRPAPK